MKIVHVVCESDPEPLPPFYIFEDRDLAQRFLDKSDPPDKHGIREGIYEMWIGYLMQEEDMQS